MQKKAKIYIASPFGFSESGDYFMKEKLFPLLNKLGYEIIDPWTLTPSKLINEVSILPYGNKRKEAWKKLNIIIGKNNANGIINCNGVLALLDGVDVDSGTASEIGFAAANKKIIIGYRGDFRLSSDNEGAIVNLQVEYFIKSSGGKIITRFSDLEKTLIKLIPNKS